MFDVRECIDPSDIEKTFDVMKQLRPLLDRESYVDLVQSLMQTGNYHLVALFTENNLCVTVASYRVQRNLYRQGGSELYVPDLVTHESHRSQGFGKKMLDWLKKKSTDLSCSGLALDCGMDREKTHDFYKREGLKPVGYHFHFYKEQQVELKEKN